MLTIELFINEQLLSSLNNKSNNGGEKFRPIVGTSLLLTKVSPFYERLTKDLGLQFWEVQFPRQ